MTENLEEDRYRVRATGGYFEVWRRPNDLRPEWRITWLPDGDDVGHTWTPSTDLEVDGVDDKNKLLAWGRERFGPNDDKK